MTQEILTQPQDVKSTRKSVYVVKISPNPQEMERKSKLKKLCNWLVNCVPNPNKSALVPSVY